MSTPHGLSIPFRLEGGRLATSSGAAKIEEDLIHLLLTAVGERPIRRALGGGLRELVYEPDNPALRALLRRRVAQLVQAHAPEVRLLSVELRGGEGPLTLALTWAPRPSGEPRSLNLPLSPGVTP